ncbi:MAG: ABC transporter ATP-binding protein [Lachnospiraceae bacterium]
MLEIEHLKIDFYDTAEPVTVVEDVSFRLDAAEMVALVGESGSGKSITALSVMGLLNSAYTKVQGSISFKGRDLLQYSEKEWEALRGNEISMVFQEPMTALNPVKKIGVQVQEALRLHTSLKKQELYERTIEILASMGLKEPHKLYHRYPHELSGGMRQRVVIAAAMIHNPSLLLADEPTTALDRTTQGKIMELFQSINRQYHTAILLITHDLRIARQICSRILVMKEGRIVETGTTEEVFRNPQHPYTRRLIEAAFALQYRFGAKEGDV